MSKKNENNFNKNLTAAMIDILANDKKTNYEYYEEEIMELLTKNKNNGEYFLFDAINLFDIESQKDPTIDFINWLYKSHLENKTSLERMGFEKTSYNFANPNEPALVKYFDRKNDVEILIKENSVEVINKKDAFIDGKLTMAINRAVKLFEIEINKFNRKDKNKK